MLKDKEERTIIYRAYVMPTRKIEVVSKTQVEKVLRLVWQEISNVVRRRKYEILEVQLRKIATDRLHSPTPLKSEEVGLLHVYLERCIS